MSRNALSELDYSDKVRKRATREAFEFSVPAAGVVVVTNASYGDEKDGHTHSVNVENGVPVGCTCKADEHQPGACKHRVAVAITAPVLAAASASGPDGSEKRALADGGQVLGDKPQGTDPEDTDAAGCPHGNGEFCETGTDEPRPERCWPCFEDTRA